MGAASAKEMREANRCVLCVHFMFDRDDFVYKLVRDDYMELLDEMSEDEDDNTDDQNENNPNRVSNKRIVFSSEVPFSQLPRIEGWFKNTTAPECCLIALLQHFNWLVASDPKNNAQNWDSFAVDYNFFVAHGSNFDGYNVEIIKDSEKQDLKDSLSQIEFSMDYEIHDMKDKIPMAEQCWEDDLWTGNARDTDEWLEFLERRFEKDEIHLRCIIKTDEMEPKFFLKFINRMLCHDGAEIIFDNNKIEQVKQWEEMQSDESESENENENENETENESDDESSDISTDKDEIETNDDDGQENDDEKTKTSEKIKKRGEKKKNQNKNKNENNKKKDQKRDKKNKNNRKGKAKNENEKHKEGKKQKQKKGNKMERKTKQQQQQQASTSEIIAME